MENSAKQKKLTNRQRKFVDLYLQLGNAAEAAEQAGFKRSYAQGAMRQEAVKEYMNRRMEEMREKNIASADEVLMYLTEVMRGGLEDGKNAASPRMKAAELLGKRLGVFNEVRSVLRGEMPVVVDDIGENEAQ